MTVTPARQIHNEINRLEQLRQTGPCPLPEPSAASWCDPVWLDLWLRNHPELIDQQQTAYVQVLARMNNRKAKR